MTLMSDVSYKISRGTPYPFGTKIDAHGVNFAIVSVHAKSLSLCLFAPDNTDKPFIEIPLDSIKNKTGNVWHIFIHGLPQDFLYLYRVDGSEHLLLDPYAKEVITTNIWGANRERYRPLGGIIPENNFQWESDSQLRIPKGELVIYEMHVRGFTKDQSSHVEHPGTFLGVIEKIPHLLDLGVNAVELMPVFEFNECEIHRLNPLTKQELYNYWGYTTVNFFSPMQRYASSGKRQAAITEFKTMVKELHKNGIEVILDVVYNHTGEGNGIGPTLSFKGLDNSLYYILDKDGAYLNYSGCGNTFNCNHPLGRELIIDSLRYWVTEMHVDGFRFDLASILTRGIKGQPLVYSPLLEKISYDPILAQVKLIAEPWDVGGLYQVGSFHSHGPGRWSEWNARYRDGMRNFIRGSGPTGMVGTNICGSQDFYHGEKPSSSVNFIVSHDGFTLMDLVSYMRKHNLGNGEDNRDGLNHNESWNCGFEGPTTIASVKKLRQQQIRNFHLALMISRGMPMILMGDEYGHTKCGNNNTWCQDNTLNWFLWDHLEQHRDFYRFYKSLIHFRHAHAQLWEDNFVAPEDILWHGFELGKALWNTDKHFVALTIKDRAKGEDLYIAFNAGKEAAEIELPTNAKVPEGMNWQWVVDTAAEPPKDFYELNGKNPVEGTHTKMVPHSAIMLKLQI